MKAAWYESQGPARQVLVTGEMPDPNPGAGEVRIRVAVSGVNPGDVKKRQDAFKYGMPYPRVIPHSDGAGVVDMVGDGVSSDWFGKRVWCFGAQSYRPFGTAAEFTVVPLAQIAPLPANVPLEQGACLGIPGITAHRAVFVAGPVDRRVVIVQGAAGAVGMCAVQLAYRGGARVIGTIRSQAEEEIARSAGAADVVLNDAEFTSRVMSTAPDGVDHIVEVAFGANVQSDVELLKQGGSISTYATNAPSAPIPFWEMVFKNVRLFFLGSDDFPREAKIAATRDLNAALEAGWAGFPIAEQIPLSEIARAHELVEHPTRPGRIVVMI
jgi:NADPH2:quinone reductase